MPKIKEYSTVIFHANEQSISFNNIIIQLQCTRTTNNKVTKVYNKTIIHMTDDRFKRKKTHTEVYIQTMYIRYVSDTITLSQRSV